MEDNNIKVSYKSIVDTLNEVFSNLENRIMESVEESYKLKGMSKPRRTKISFTNAFIYGLLYTQIDKTKQEIVNELSKLIGDDVELNRTSLHEKELTIPLTFYVGIYEKLTKLYLNFFKDEMITKLIAIDGTYNNTNVHNIKGFLETSMNLGFFDVGHDFPLDITFNGIEKKNSELPQLINYIHGNLDKFKNVIIIMDRGFCSNKFIKLLNSKNIKYICRFRNNCKFADKIKNENRVVNFTKLRDETVINNKIDTHLINNKKFNSVEVEIKDEYNLVTNLDKSEYNDEEIKKMYLKRWNIEIFFKILKQNFKFEDLRITSNGAADHPYNLHNIKILIVYILSKIFEKTDKIINDVKTEGVIKKRQFKNKKVKNNVPPATKKSQKETEKNNKIKNQPINSDNTINNDTANSKIINVVNNETNTNTKVIIENDKNTKVNNIEQPIIDTKNKKRGRKSKKQIIENNDEKNVINNDDINKNVNNETTVDKKTKPETKTETETETQIINIDIKNAKQLRIKNDNQPIIKKNVNIEVDKPTDTNKLDAANTIDLPNDNKTKITEQTTRKCNIKPNKALLIKGVFTILYDIIHAKLTETTLTRMLNLYIKHIKTDPTITNKRVCKTPFKKWYIKGYTHKSDFNKIIAYLLGFTKEIHKNLKTLSKDVTITKINYVD